MSCQPNRRRSGGKMLRTITAAFRLRALSMELAGGTLNGDVALNASGKVAAVAANRDGKAIELGRLEALKEKLGGGPTDVTLRFKGSGNSSQAIAGSGSGLLLVKVGAATLRQKKKKGGFLAAIGELVNPFSKKDNSTLDCAVINFRIRDGIATADRGIGMETRQITVSGGGQINLKNEQLALGFEPHATGAVAGTISNLASGMKAEGTLADPKIRINPAGVAMEAIKSVAGGAESIIGGIFGKGEKESEVYDTAPCRTALTGKPTLSSTATAGTGDTDSGSAEEKQSVPEKILEKPKELLKGLFD